MPIGIGTAALTTGLAEGLGTAALASLPGWLGAAGILETGLLGAGVGAGANAIFGRDPLTGAITGGIGGLAQGAGPLLGDTLGIGALGGDVLAGAGLGAGGAALTGKDPLKGAALGGVGGLTQAMISQALGPAGGATSPSGAPIGTAGPGVSGGAGAAAGSVAGGLPTDLTGIPEIVVNAGPTSVAAGSPAAGLLGPALGTGSSLAASSLLAPPAEAGSGSVGGGDFESGTGSLGTLDTKTLPTGSSPFGGAGTRALQVGEAAAAKLPSSLDNFLTTPSVQNFGKIIGDNPSLILGGAGLAYQAANQPKLPSVSATTNSLNDTAKNLASQGNALESYINNGKLPPGAMAAVNRAAEAAKATLRSRFASLGLSGSTQEATAIAGVDQQTASQVFDIAKSLLDTGVKESGLAADIYEQILNQGNKQNDQLSSAVSNFAATLAGGSIPKATA